VASNKAGGPFAIAGFVYQFLNTIDLGLTASLKKIDGDETVLVLEPQHADAAARGVTPRIVQYKMRRGRDWTNRTILFEILPPLLRATLADPEVAYSPAFVTSAAVQGGVALRATIAALGAGRAAPPLKVGHKLMEAEAILAEIAARTAVSMTQANNPAFLGDIRDALARLSIEEKATLASVRQRVMSQLHRVTGSRRRAAHAYNALFRFIAERSQEPGALISACEFLEAAELTADRLAPLLHFERHLADLTGDALQRRGYARHKDVRKHAVLPDSSLVLVEGPSGSGKSWSLAGLTARALERGEAALWLDEVANLEALGTELIGQLWHLALRRSETDCTSLPTLTDDIAGLLSRETPVPLLVALDRLPRLQAERERLLRFDWARAGIRLLVGVTSEEATDIQASIAAPVLTVGDFTQTELKELLNRSGIAWASLPADVRSWIRRPVLAGVYVSLAADSGDWCGTSEFELMERFADRAERRGQSVGIYGCRQLIAALGGEALDHLQPLDLTRLSPSPTPDQLRILAETGWLQRDGQGNFAFAHDRLRDWAIAENLVTTIHDPGALAHRLVAVAGYSKEESAHPVVQAGYALMDGVWLLAKGTGGTDRLRAFLDVVDHGDWAWQLPDDLYGDLLPDGGPPLFDALLPILAHRLTSQADGHHHYHAVRCLDGFVRAGRIYPEAIATLLWSDNAQAQAYGCRFAVQQPEPRYLDRLAQLHKETDKRKPDDQDLWALSRAAWNALRTCLAVQPGWLVARFDRASANQANVAHLISLLPHVAEGREIWAPKGRALVAALGQDRHTRYWLARAIEAFEDDRFDAELADWSLSSTDMAAIPAWSALCRRRPDLVAAVAPRLPKGVFSLNTSRWLQPLLAPEAKPALRIVLETLKRQDPSGCSFAFALTHHGNDLDLDDLRWAAYRLDAALATREPGDLTASRLLDLFMEIDEPALIECLPSLIPETLPGRLLALAEAKLKTHGLWYDPELQGAITLLQKLGGAHAVAVTRAQLRAAHPNARWMAIREAGFADISLVRSELESIATAGDEEKEPGRLEALQLLAMHDPSWGHEHIAAKLAEGTASARNEAFWLAIRMRTNDYVADGVALLPQTFSGEYPLFRAVEYLIAHRTALEDIADLLSAALPKQPKHQAWIVDRLLSLGLDAADETVLSAHFPKAGSFEQAEIAFWGFLNRSDQPRWQTLAEQFIAGGEARQPRHGSRFYEVAAKLGRGPAYDQLLSDAFPAQLGGWERALRAIRALGAHDEIQAAEALTRLCRLIPEDDRDIERFAALAARSGFPGAQLAILRGALHWPVEALERALARPAAGHAPSLITAVAHDLESPSPAVRRAAAIASPLVLGRAPAALLEDKEEHVRLAAVAATRFHAERRRAQALLAEVADGPPDRARRAAAALFSIAERNEPKNNPRSFSWAEFAAAAPQGSGILMAIPR
jgi:hypothetical protein